MIRLYVICASVHVDATHSLDALQVGSVSTQNDDMKGMYIAAGYCGHGKSWLLHMQGNLEADIEIPIVGMPRAFAWYVRLHSLPFHDTHREPHIQIPLIHSAEVVAQMIIADRLNKKWTPPSWFPLWYLTPASRSTP